VFDGKNQGRDMKFLTNLPRTAKIFTSSFDITQFYSADPDNPFKWVRPMASLDSLDFREKTMR
jgi:hypothetical protein